MEATRGSSRMLLKDHQRLSHNCCRELGVCIWTFEDCGEIRLPISEPVPHAQRKRENGYEQSNEKHRLDKPSEEGRKD